MTRTAVLLSVCLVACERRIPRFATSTVPDFQKLFATNCSGCHGASGRDGAAPPLNNPLYLRIVPREALQQTVENGRPGTPMPAWSRARGGPLQPAEITALVDGIEHWAGPFQADASLPPYSVAPGDAAKGQPVFQAACAPCHSRGTSIVDPSFLALTSDQGLRTTVLVGSPALGMPDYTETGVAEQDVNNLVAWLASNRPAIRRPEPAESTNQFPGNQGSGSSSIRGGPGASKTNTTSEKHQ